LADVAAIQEGCGRGAVAVHPKRIPRQGQGSQLATCPQRALLHGHAPLLAEDRGDGGQVDRAAAEAGSLNALRRAVACAFTTRTEEHSPASLISTCRSSCGTDAEQKALPLPARPVLFDHGADHRHVVWKRATW